MAVLLFLSTVIATCGLLANSAALVIGAILIAPIWLDDLHVGLKQNMKEDGLDIDFKIQTNWTRSVQISWPPPAAGELNPNEIVNAALEKRELLKNKVWDGAMFFVPITQGLD